MAVFWSAVLASSVPAPIAVLKLLVVLLLSERYPTAVLKPPVVSSRSAFCPSTVLPPGYLHPVLEQPRMLWAKAQSR
jgi:hypothetical protein